MRKMQKEHAGAMLEMQNRTNETTAGLMQKQMELLQVENKKHAHSLSHQVQQMYAEKDKDRQDKDKDRLAQWAQGQQTLALAMSTSNGT